MARQLDPNLPAERKPLRKPAKATRSTPGRGDDEGHQTHEPTPPQLRLPPLPTLSHRPDSSTPKSLKLALLPSADVSRKENSPLARIRAEYSAVAPEKRRMITISSDEDHNKPRPTPKAVTRPSKLSKVAKAATPAVVSAVDEGDQAKLDSVSGRQIRVGKVTAGADKGSSARSSKLSSARLKIN